MNTYLILFGKSQDFTFYAFDRSSYINDFNSVIKDFDELESRIFTIDEVSNKEILSKYNFNKNGKNYSLLKLYSLGQATNGSRIAGSIYGVALLSENEIELTESNNAILNVVKKNFASLCLDGAKFKMSDFYSQAETIWKAIINHKDGNYFNKITYRNGNFNTNNKVKAFYINDILKNSFDVNNEINNASRLYFSNDLEHLKRTQSKRGKDAFPIYVKENNQFILYTEKPKFIPSPVDDNQGLEISELRFRNTELRNELSELEGKYRNFKQKANKNFKIASILAIVFCLSTSAFFLKSIFEDSIKRHELVVALARIKKLEKIINGVKPPNGHKQNQINLKDILADDEKLKTFNNLLQNIENYNKSLNGKPLNTRYNKIKEDLQKLGLDVSLAENYKLEESAPPSKIKAETAAEGKANYQQKKGSEDKAKAKVIDDKLKADADAKDKTEAEKLKNIVQAKESGNESSDTTKHQ